MNRKSRIYVAGGETLIGAALIHRLRETGHEGLLGVPPDEPDLTNAGQVEDFFSDARPEYVFLAAGRSGGIAVNSSRPADLMLHNLLVLTQVMPAARTHEVKKLLYIASSCCYPQKAPQPLTVDSLMTGVLEPTCEAYATAKLAGIQLCQAFRRQHGSSFITAIPADTFGPSDDFDPASSHVLAALLHRFHEARKQGECRVVLWGTGQPRREFVYAPDLADACLLVMNRYDDPRPINLGGGTEMTVAALAHCIAEVVGYRGRIEFDVRRPDGAARKALDAAPLHALGWRPRTSFRTALEQTYDWFLRHVVKEDRTDVPATV